MWGGVAMALRAPSAEAWLRRAGVSAQVWHPTHPALSHPSGDRAPPTAHPAAATLGTGTRLPQGPGAHHRTPAPAASSTHAVNMGQESHATRVVQVSRLEEYRLGNNPLIFLSSPQRTDADSPP